MAPSAGREGSVGNQSSEYTDSLDTALGKVDLCKVPLFLDLDYVADSGAIRNGASHTNSKRLQQ